MKSVSEDLKRRDWIIVALIVSLGVFYPAYSLGQFVFFDVDRWVLIGVTAGTIAGMSAGLEVRRNGKARLANVSILLGGVVAGIMFGGGLLGQLWMNKAWIASPPSSLALIQPPLGDGLMFFFVLFNPLMEVLLVPLALYLNWRVPMRRTLIIVAAVVYYAMRVWTYAYFVPGIMVFGTTPADGPYSPILAERATQWVNLSWYRVVMDGITHVLFFGAAFVSGRPLEAARRIRTAC
jgi:hypothetical protein